VILTHRGAQRTLPARLAFDTQPFDEVEDDLGSGPRKRVHAPSQLGPEVAFDGVRIMFQAGIYLPAVASGGTPARLFRLQQGHLHARFGQMQCSRQARESPADDRDIGARVAVERRRRDAPLGAVSI
jgi:hypothetical protein